MGAKRLPTAPHRVVIKNPTIATSHDQRLADIHIEGDWCAENAARHSHILLSLGSP
jgi:hypothetical protein